MENVNEPSTKGAFKHDYDQMIQEIESMHGYKIAEKIGEGSFGVVLSATRQDDNKNFAIKVYKEPFKTQYIAR